MIYVSKVRSKGENTIGQSRLKNFLPDLNDGCSKIIKLNDSIDKERHSLIVSARTETARCPPCPLCAMCVEKKKRVDQER